MLQEYRSALRLAIEFKQYQVVDAFLDTHPDVKPGLRGPPELDSTDKVTLLSSLKAQTSPSSFFWYHFIFSISFFLNPLCLFTGWLLSLYVLQYGDTDLLYACKENDLEVVNKILRKGADPNIPNNVSCVPTCC